MKLATRMVVVFSLIIILAISLCQAFIFINSYNLIIAEAKDKAVLFLKTFEAQAYSGFHTEDKTGVNASYEHVVLQLRKILPQIVEINVYKISGGGVIVASDDQSKIGMSADPEDLAAAKNDETIVLMHRTGKAVLVDVTGPLHQNNLIDYTMGVTIDIQGDWARINSLLLETGGIAVGAILLIMVVIGFTARSIVRPISGIAALLKGMSEAEGDLTKRLDLKRKDEIGILAAHFDTFITKLREIVIGLKASQAGIVGIADRLRLNSNDTASAVAQISASIGRVRDQAGLQSESALESSSAVEEIAKSIESLDKMIADQADCVSAASASIEEMVGNVASVTMSVQKMAGQFAAVTTATEEGMSAQAATAALIAQISEHSQSLGDANRVIKNISSKTNLLAMNAAIEAAHAGEAGKGFSVVADEIRTLAENSAQQSGMIGKDIAVVQNAIQAVVNSSGALSAAFKKVEGMITETGTLVQEIESAMSEQGKGSADVLEVLGTLNGITASVRLGSKEMRNGNQTLIGETNNLRGTAGEIKLSMDEMAQGAKGLALAAQNVAVSAEETRETIETIETNLGRFKV